MALSFAICIDVITIHVGFYSIQYVLNQNDVEAKLIIDTKRIFV
jgi:hypothetical protein